MDEKFGYSVSGASFSSQLLHLFRQARARGSIVLLSRPPRPSSPIFHDAPPRSARARFAVHRPPCSPRRPHPEDAPVAGVNVDSGGWTRNTCAVSHLPPSSFPPRGAARAHASRCTTFCHLPPSYRPQLEGAPVWKVPSSTHHILFGSTPQLSHLPPSSLPPRGAARAHASPRTTFRHLPPSYPRLCRMPPTSQAYTTGEAEKQAARNNVDL